MTTRPTVRSAQETDLTAMRRVAAEALAYDEDGADLVDLLWSGPRTPPDVRLVADVGGRTVGVALGSYSTAGSTRGHVNLLAVAPTSQGEGIGRALLAALEERLLAGGARQLVIRGSAPQYAWPGIDLRYTAALCLAESSGYSRTAEGLNMTVDLARAPLDTAADVDRLAAAGITVRRARPGDEPRLTAWVRTFGGTWHAEAAAALARQPIGCHVAVRSDGGEEFVGFACHGANRRAWFGPMATAESLRGQGVGAVLLRRCLADQRDAGLRQAEIGWTGPIRFYTRAVGATLDRVFWLYQKDR
jgi:mycothiol synthase